MADAVGAVSLATCGCTTGVLVELVCSVVIAVATFELPRSVNVSAEDLDWWRCSNLAASAVLVGADIVFNKKQRNQF